MEPREGWKRKARSAARTCSVQPDQQGRAQIIYIRYKNLLS